MGRHWNENSALPSPLAAPAAANLTSVSVHNGLTLTTAETIGVYHYDFFYSLANGVDDWTEHALERNKPNLVGDIFLDTYGCDLTGWTIVGSWSLVRNIPLQTFGRHNFHSINKATWDSIPYGPLPILHSVSFGNFVYGYLCGDNGFIIGTNDGGYDWRKQISPTTAKSSGAYIFRSLSWL